MKRNFTIALLFLLLFAMITGCAPRRRMYDSGRSMYTPPVVHNTPDAYNTPVVTPNEGAVQIPEQNVPMESPDAASTYPTPDPEMISQQLAMDIALLNAGITADQAEFLRVEFDIDDRRPVYEVQFYVNRMEYEYEIHAKTGEILYFEQDYD